MQQSWVRIVVLALGLILPPLAVSKSNHPKKTNDAFVCGTSAERETNALVSGRYHADLLRRQGLGRGRVLLAAEPVAAAFDSGDVAVIEDDGTIIRQPNPFDLAGRSFRFEPASANSYRVVATPTPFNATGGTSLRLADDDTVTRNLGFTFTFYGKTYTAVQLNSDGNLTFGAGDVSTLDRDLGRFASGPPRIGPFFTDLDPSRGAILVRDEADGIVFVWSSVPQFSEAGSSLFNNFSVKLYRNGNIEFVYGTQVDSTESIVGISPGGNQDGISAVSYSSALPTSELPGTIAESFATQFVLSETAAAKKFFQNHPDSFDHLNLFLAFDYDLGGNAYAYELNVKNEIEGIALGTDDHSLDYGSNHRLRSFLNMGTLTGPNRYPSDPNEIFLGTNNTLGLMGQESGHRWLAFTPFLDPTTGRSSTSILGRDLAHWSFFMDSDGSVMEGNDIEDRGAGFGSTRFRTIRATDTYSMLDQYIMGLRGKEDVPSMFFVQNPTGTLKQAASNPSIGVSFGGTRRDFTVDQIISANGLRVPSVFQAPKVFRQGFILLTQRGQTATQEQIQKVQRIRDAWVEFFNRETQGRGWIVTNLQDTPGTTPTRMLFPYFHGNTQRYTGIAIANWGSTPADVTFQAYSNNGSPVASPSSIINPRVLTIPPGAQIAMLAEQIHGLLLSDPRDGWIVANSTSSQVTGFFLDGDVDLKLLDGAVAASGTATTLIFDRAQQGAGIFGSQALRNLINVVNPNPGEVQLTFRLVNDRGEDATATASLSGNARLSQDLASLFPGSGTRQSGYVRLTSTGGVVGYQSVDTGADSFALPAQAPANATRLYSAQFASGGVRGIQYFTDLNLINTSAQTRSVQVLLVGNNGVPVAGITNPATLRLEPGQQSRTRGDAVFGLPDPALTASIVEGSLLVTADGPGVVGDVVFGDALNQKFIASLPLDANPASNIVLSQVAQGSPNAGKPYFTGVALYNPNNTAVQVTLDVYSEQGTKTGTGIVSLPAGNRISRTLPELVPAISNQVRGFIRLTSSGGPVVTFELFGDQAQDFLAAVPPQPIQP